MLVSRSQSRRHKPGHSGKRRNVALCVVFYGLTLSGCWRLGVIRVLSVIYAVDVPDVSVDWQRARRTTVARVTYVTVQEVEGHGWRTGESSVSASGRVSKWQRPKVIPEDRGPGRHADQDHGWPPAARVLLRSEERRVGKECRS